MEPLLAFLFQNEGDHLLNTVGRYMLLGSCVGFAFVYLTQFFIFKSGFKLSNIRRLHRGQIPDDSGEGRRLSGFGRLWSYTIRLCLLSFVLGGVLMIVPFE